MQNSPAASSLGTEKEAAVERTELFQAVPYPGLSFAKKGQRFGWTLRIKPPGKEV
ncbi:unnamed protein product [marine sediment metagenome]|uniref:Uncharacterized protein n=1 Tax=marine sediment metagenome TaxID=412755 RepID=X1SZS5_9ZZZZ